MAALALAFVAIAEYAVALTFVDVTSCTDVVGPKTIGVLQNDIACEAQYDRIYVDADATLDLNGFTITKTEDLAITGPGWDEETAVYCPHKCTVLSSVATAGKFVGPIGGGMNDRVVAIEGGYYNDLTNSYRVKVSNVEFSGFDTAVFAKLARIYLFDVSFTSNADYSADGTRINAHGVTLVGPQFTGFDANIIKARSVTCTNDLSYCFYGNLLNLKEVEVHGNGIGAFCDRIRLRDTVFSGNDLDIVSRNPPKLTDSSCESSRQIDPYDFISSETWGVCSLD